ncbi:MAG: tetratricopeptide repeat protein [Bacteroidales bacterium]
MKRSFIMILTGVLSVQMAFSQISFSERRQRDQVYHDGVSLILKEEFEMASAKLTESLEIDPAFAPAYLQRGRILIQWGSMDRAMGDLDSAIRFDPGLGEAFFYKGYIMFGSDTTGMDADLFDLAISKGYHDPYAYYFRGLTGIRDGFDGKAINDMSQAIVLKSDFALAYHERAGIKRRMGDLQGAHFDYRTATEYDPGFALAYNNLGSVKILLGDYEGAIEQYTKALELNPKMVLALNNRGYASYFLGNLDAAMDDFDIAINLESGFAEASLNKSSILASQNNLEPALTLLDFAIVENPGVSLLYLNRGLIQELKGNLSEACEDWKMALELGAREAEAYVKECNE